MNTIWKLTVAQLRMYVRDRQSVFFALFFPLLFMLALGFMVSDTDVEPIEIGVVASESVEAGSLVQALEMQSLLNVHQETEAAARDALKKGERRLVVVIPENYSGNTTEQHQLTILVDAGKPQEVQQGLAILQSTLTEVERELRNEAPLFALTVEDVEARQSRYIDFLIPGLLALMVMQLSIAGSGFNIVEYKRKGILKRLFVTPLRPLAFIISLIVSRLVIVLAQITLMLAVAKIVFDVEIVGSWLLLYLFAILGGILFLALGFVLGGIAKTQNSVMTIGNLFIFPQMFLAGVFFALESLPTWLQPVAQLLPLSFVSSAMRLVANEATSVGELTFDLVGIAAWIALGLFLAVYFFRWGEEANS